MPPGSRLAADFLRVEVRAKSDLKIRMSDAPNNPERRWDVGLRNDDVAAFIAILGTTRDRTPLMRPCFSRLELCGTR